VKLCKGVKGKSQTAVLAILGQNNTRATQLENPCVLAGKRDEVESELFSPGDFHGIPGDEQRGVTVIQTVWKGWMPRYRFGSRVNVFCSGNAYSETMPTNVITH
jgi:hypothetical protein